MSVRVRFAPSPTGYLHIGGARTALYCYLYAKSKGGSFILRIEDTDTNRSRKEFEQAQMDDLRWLGLTWDEGPDFKSEFGPYRQSERSSIYTEMANQLLKEKKAFHCFCTEEILEQKKLKASEEGTSPVYDGTCRKLDEDEVKKRLEAGEKATVRFIAPQKDYQFKDIVRGDVTFPAGMVGDFVILRSDGTPVYNFCCVVDDWKMKISDVIRAEEHLPNTLRQLMLYEAFNAKSPNFAHVSLLVGEDRQKLSKRHGATSLKNFRDQLYSQAAIINYLSLLGWSHPEEKNIFDLEELIRVFDLTRFNKAPAVFDYQKFKWVNGQHLKASSNEEVCANLNQFLQDNSFYQKRDHNWKMKFVEFFKQHSDTYQEFAGFLNELTQTNIEKNEELDEILGWETTPRILAYITEKINPLNNEEALDEEIFNEWSNDLKKNEKIKGKSLFMGMRACLTGKAHGKDLKTIVSLTPVAIIKLRLEQLKGMLNE